ncbi:MAG: RICIN domain-containing protein, partial [Ruminococcus sp.]|nr:RICIN domain-containing protein [Ruminococcus sp.]
DGQLNIQAVPGKEGYAYTMSALEIKQISSDATMKPTIWLCGDSTVCNYYNTTDSAQHGWGQFLGEYIGTDKYEIRNMAASGQYAKGFVDAGQFDAIEYYGKTVDIYIISIGINDTNYSNADEYTSVVTDMVKRAKAKGMEVIRVKQQGRRGDLQRTSKLSGRWFGGELDSIGAAQNVKVLDLFNKWQNFGFSVGYDGMASYYAIQANGKEDDLHQSMKGAKKIAEIMASMLELGSSSSQPATEPPQQQFIAPETGVSYMIKNVNSGLYMDVENGKAEGGTNVQQWGASDPSANNTWTFKQAVGEYYWIYSNVGDGATYMLDVTDGSKTNGTNIAIQTKNGYSNQYFKLLDNGDGTVTILTRATYDASAVEVTSALTDNGANVQQWEVNGHNCQKWILEKSNYSSVPAVTPTEPPTEIPATEPPVTSGRLIGDANEDGSVGLSDALAILQYIANARKYPLTEQGIRNADIFNDGLTASDALFIQPVDAGIEKFPVDEPAYQEPVVTEPVTEPSQDNSEKMYFSIDQQWDKGITETVNAGFTDQRGYLNLENELGSSVTFTVDVSSDGNYMTKIRFANGSENDRKMKVFVNGNISDYWMQSFTSTGAWTNWNEFGIVLPLKAGSNSIRFESATSEGGPNFDYITIKLTDEPYAETYDPSSEQQNVTVSDKPVIYIAGDSTVQSYRESYKPQQGWGYYLGSYFTDNVAVSNQSIAGRSSKKFYDEGRWKTIADSLNQGDFVMIQFAINDAGASYADRYAPVCGNVDNPSSGSYEWYMSEFIKDTLAKNGDGFIMAMWCGDEACEDSVKEQTGVGSRCIPTLQKNLSDKCVCCGKPAKHMVCWGNAY